MIYLSENLLLQHIITLMRDERCGVGQFRRLMERAAQFLTYEAIGKVPIEHGIVSGRTDRQHAYEGKFLDSESFCLVSSLQTGAVMAGAAHLALPNATFACVNFVRDKKNNWVDVHRYLPESLEDKYCVIYEPAIATGAITTRLVELLLERNCSAEKIIIVAINGAEVGVEAITAKYSKLPIILGSLDPDMDADGWIIPGIGDFQNRLYGIKTSSLEV